MSIPLWYMDAEFCPGCDALLGYFGECPSGCKDDEEEEWEGDDDPYLRFDEDGEWEEGEEGEPFLPSFLLRRPPSR